MARGEDFSILLLEGQRDLHWLRAWMFMEMCGFQAGEIPETEDDD